MTQHEERVLRRAFADIQEIYPNLEGLTADCVAVIIKAFTLLFEERPL